jgi:hypothetical protein
MRFVYRGPVAAVTLRGPDGTGKTTYHLSPGAEVDLPDCSYTRSLKAQGMLLEPAAAPKAAVTTAPAPDKKKADEKGEVTR